MADPDYREIEVVGDAVEIASFRLHMRNTTNYIVEETPLRIRFVASKPELPFLRDFPNQTRETRNGKVFIFLIPKDINSNVDSLARNLNN